MSYRREDSDIARLIHYRLVERYGKASVFYDLDLFSPGQDIKSAVESAVAAVDVVLVIIGRNWARDLHKSDWVRLEVDLALRLGKTTIPVLIDNANPPSAHELPDELQTISYLLAMRVAIDSLERDIEYLVAGLRRFQDWSTPPASKPTISAPPVNSAQVNPPPVSHQPVSPPPVNPPSVADRRDFVITHSPGVDDGWVEWICWHLRSEGYGYYLDQNDFSAERPLIAQFSEWLQVSGGVLIVVTRAFLEDSRRSAEWDEVKRSGMLRQAGRAVVVAVEQLTSREIREALELPDSVPIVSLLGVDEATARTSLMSTLKGVVAAPTDEAPAFPPQAQKIRNEEEPYAFISYSRVDLVYVEQLTSFFTARDVRTWVDHHIDYGDRWIRVIRDKVDSCSAFVVIMTPDAEESVWVEREIQRAQFRSKPILPVLLRGSPFFLLAETQHENRLDGSLPSEDFAQKVARLLTSR